MQCNLKVLSALVVSWALALAGPPVLASSEYFGTDKNQTKVTPRPTQPVPKPVPHKGTPSKPSSLTAAQVYAKCAPAVVTIAVSLGSKFVGHGSGFFVSPKGFILTNSHVVNISSKHRFTYTAITHSGKKIPLQVVKTDPEIDLALLKASGSGFSTLRPGKASELKVGDPVYIIGTPVRLEFRSTMTNGLVSGVSRRKGRLQTNAVIHGGNSGGPVINSQGQVVAVAVAVATKVQRKKMQIKKNKVADVATLEAADGISYMIPIEYGRNLLNIIY